MARYPKTYKLLAALAGPLLALLPASDPVANWGEPVEVTLEDGRVLRGTWSDRRPAKGARQLVTAWGIFPIPVELIRAELLGQRLSEEWSPGWEF